MKKLLAYIAAVFSVGLLASIFFLYSFAHAQVSGSLWKLISNQLLPVNSAWGVTVPSLANLNCIGTNGSGVFGAGTCAGGGGTFPFTPTSYGVSTTTTIGLLNGFLSNASSTLSASTTINNQLTVTGNSYLQSIFTNLGTGAVYTQSGALLSHATTSTSVASQDVWRDGNANIFANNVIPSVTSTASNGGTVTMTPSFTRYQILTGVLTETYQLPNANASGMATGATFEFNNNSTGILTVTDHGGNVQAIVPAGGFVKVIETDNGSANGLWEAHALLGHSNVSGSGTLGVGSSTPWGQLSVFAGGDYLAHAASTLFAVGSSTAGTATSTLFTINSAGVASSTSLVVSTAETFSNLITGVLHSTAGVISSSAVSLTADITGILGLANGGTNASLSGASQLIAMNSGNTALTTGGTGYTLTSSLLTATNASTTALTAGSYFESIGNAGFGTTTPAFTLSVNNSGSDFYVNSSGEIVGRDTTNAWNGRITPTIPLTYNVATSTATFTGTSTPGVDITPTQTAPFTGLIRGVRCNSNTFLGFILTDNGTATTSYIVASSTVNHILFASALSITAGDKLTAYAGTTTSATVGSGVVYASCTFEATQTP